MGTADDLVPQLTGNLTPGSLVFHLEKRLGTQAQELKEELRQRSRRMTALGRGTANPRPGAECAGGWGRILLRRGRGPVARVEMPGAQYRRALSHRIPGDRSPGPEELAGSSRLRLSSAGRLANGAVHTYFAHEEQRRRTGAEQAG